MSIKETNTVDAIGSVLPPREFAQSSTVLAPRLLNKLLLVRTKTQGRAGRDDSVDWVGGRIVEVEAYDQDDPASHSFRGPTPRCEVMFGPGGRLYVYRSYGVHWCANAVCGPVGHGAAVLIRALAPTHGLDHQWGRREKAKRCSDLASGPGKLCAALGITRDDNAAVLFDPNSRAVVVDDGTLAPVTPKVGPRIGISKAIEKPWRWWVDDCEHVSRPR